MTDAYSDLRHIKLPFDLDNVDDQCIDCVRKQLKKYEKFMDENGKSVANKFLVPCDGIPKYHIDPSLRDTVSDDIWSEMEAVVDIVKWADKYLKLPSGAYWTARWYQEKVLRCTAKRKMLRCSRRIGKCISSKSLVFTEDGPITAKELYESNKDPTIATFNQNTLQTEFASAFISYNGEKEVFRLKTKNGRETIITDNHPFLVYKSKTKATWTELKDLQVGDKIAVPSTYQHLPIKDPKKISDARSLGKEIRDNNSNFIPRDILQASNKDIANFIAGYLGPDGQSTETVIESKDLTIQLKHLLLRLGINSEVTEQDNLSYKITLQDQDVSTDYFWDPVALIEEAGIDDTYDLSVPSNHTLIADDIISHNTDMVSVEICYYLFTEPNVKIVVAGPQKTHTEEIITRVRSFIHSNPLLSAMVIRDVSAPYYEIKLSNGARVRGFAAGAKGGSEGVGIRGQDADRLYCFPKGTLVNTSEFAVQPIETLRLKDSILGGDHNGIQTGEITNLGVRKKSLITIPTVLNTVKCTPDHPLFNGIRDVQAKDAEEVIVSLYHQDLKFSKDVIFARLLGYFLSGGKLFGPALKQIQTDLKFLSNPAPKTIDHIYLAKLLKDNYSCQLNQIPNEIIHGDNNIKESFLSGLFSTTSARVDLLSTKTKFIDLCIDRLAYSFIPDIRKILSDISLDYTIKVSDSKDKVHIQIANIDKYINNVGFCYDQDKTGSANKYKLFNYYKQNQGSKSISLEEYIKSITWKGNYVLLPILKENVSYSNELVDVYNLTSSAANRFFAGGMFTHNCEEMDYIDPKAITSAVIPLLSTSPDTALVGFSTPSGFQTPYYKFCTENPYYVEFHYSYKVLPHWKRVEMERDQFTTEEWTHEYCFAGYQKILIYTENSIEEKEIKDISVNDSIYSNCGEKIVKVLKTFKNSRRPLLEVTTSVGSITCTLDHGFRSLETGKKQKITDLDRLPTKYICKYIYNSSREQRLARLIGFINGDGYVVNLGTRYSARFYGEKQDLDLVAHDIKTIYGEGYCLYLKSKSKKVETWCLEANKEISLDLVKHGALVGAKTKQTNAVPDWINGSFELEKEFFGALWGAEGSTPKFVNYTLHSLALSMTLKSNEILLLFSSFLKKLNIDSTVKKNTLYIKDDISYQNFSRSQLVRYNQKKEQLLFISNLYFEERNFLYDKNFDDYYRVELETQNSNLPLSASLDYYNISRRSYNKWIKTRNSVKHKKYGQIKTFIPKLSTWYLDNVKDNLIYIPILHRRLLPEDDTYNIEVSSSDHSYFLANGIETFNCADWGSSEEGVYKPAYIDAALDTYTYDDHIRSPSWKYCIGTDWNEKHGTEIVVLGRNMLNNRFKVVESVLVAKSEFTQLSGVQKLLDMNKKWHPEFIYIDAGNGSTNMELLMKTAYKENRRGGDQDTARLLNILKKYDSGASFKIKDPITHQEIKTPAKPFMVNASVRLFEQQLISISAADQILEKQLRNYIVERMTPTKVPVYGLASPSVGDHRLDALNLAIVAFQLEFSDLHKVNVLTSVGAVPDPRTKTLHNREAQSMDNKESRPEDRRLENTNINSVFGVMPARIDSRHPILKTNRPGWETDNEEFEKQKHLQRLRKRSNVYRSRPSRTNF